MDIESLYKNEKAAVTRFLQKKSRYCTSVDIEALVQDAFVQAFKSRDQFRGECKPITWVCAIAHNLLKNSWAKNTHHNGGIPFDDCTEAFEEATPDVAEVVEQHDLINKVDELLSAINEDWADVFRMYLDGMPYDDIAKHMGIPVGTVRSRIFRVRKILYTKLNTDKESP